MYLEAGLWESCWIMGHCSHQGIRPQTGPVAERGSGGGAELEVVTGNVIWKDVFLSLVYSLCFLATTE